MFQDTVRDRLEGVRGLNRNDILASLGLSRRRSFAEGMLTAAGIFAAGAAVGTGVALLLAPKTGRDLRGQLKDRANDLSHRVKRQAKEVRGALQEGKEEFASARGNGKYEPRAAVEDWGQSTK